MRKIGGARVGGLEVFAQGDVLTVRRGKRVVRKVELPWLGSFLQERCDQVYLTLKEEDTAVLGIWGLDGFGYALNLEAPELSEWGYGGSG